MIVFNASKLKEKASEITILSKILLHYILIMLNNDY